MLEYQNKERTIERKVVIVYWSKDKNEKMSTIGYL
jgi:hypothetical protein